MLVSTYCGCILCSYVHSVNNYYVMLKIYKHLQTIISINITHHNYSYCRAHTSYIYVCHATYTCKLLYYELNIISRLVESDHWFILISSVLWSVSTISSTFCHLYLFIMCTPIHVVHTLPHPSLHTTCAHCVRSSGLSSISSLSILPAVLYSWGVLYQQHVHHYHITGVMRSITHSHFSSWNLVSTAYKYCNNNNTSNQCNNEEYPPNHKYCQ